MEQESLLSDLEFNPVLASTGKRFLNYLIDIFIFSILIIFVLVLFFTNDRYSYDNYESDHLFSHQLLLRFTVIGLFFSFYFLSELILKGRSIGKFITGTKAVNEDGTEMQSKTILLRNLSRIVPFESFSALGNPCHPWHDKWTRTYVIDVRQTALNNPSI